jgi:hypothetical protein
MCDAENALDVLRHFGKAVTGASLRDPLKQLL